MFERFTDRSRHSLMLAQDEARRLGSTVIDTDHLLLGLLDLEPNGLLEEALRAQGVEPAVLRAVLRREGKPAGTSSDGALAFSDDLKLALESALRESLRLGDDVVDAAHLCLGVLDDPTNLAARALADSGLDSSQLRAHVLHHLGAGPEVEPARRAPEARAAPSTLAADPDLAPAADLGVGTGTAMTGEGHGGISLPKVARRITGWGGTDRSLSPRSMRAALLRYRIMAYIVGTMLSILCFVGLPLQFAAHNDAVVDIVGTIHGYCYLTYLAIGYDMARRVRWKITRLIPVVLGGLVPGLAFVMERRITPQVRADIDRAEAEQRAVVTPSPASEGASGAHAGAARAHASS